MKAKVHVKYHDQEAVVKKEEKTGEKEGSTDTVAKIFTSGRDGVMLL